MLKKPRSLAMFCITRTNCGPRRRRGAGSDIRRLVGGKGSGGCVHPQARTHSPAYVASNFEACSRRGFPAVAVRDPRDKFRRRAHLAQILLDEDEVEGADPHQARREAIELAAPLCQDRRRLVEEPGGQQGAAQDR